MDSMRSLNKSLPKTKRQPDVHQSFKNAALQLTNLYKSAIADVDRARSDGYQDALDDLLTFLDKENLGVGDGEGWRIRQWATERFDGSRHTNSDEDDEVDMDDKRARSSSPIMERTISPEATRGPEAHDAVQRPDSAPPVQLEASVTEPEMSPLHQVFQFSAPQPYPSSTNASTNTENAFGDFSAAARRAFPAPRRDRHSNRSATRNLQRTATQNLFQLGQGAGQKRRMMDSFHPDNTNERRDGSGGGGPKRGRMT
ncbi:hypothetical protein C7974DRAFT_309044 [Boeremia exigua]|uniref:uncharacterized protein n=1 Tax=Boeremia exigua TaxID=749465 RepID=UPI001E8E390B|nr:uncharacterized protein C7974DRAFT_309044 [Boeremia exigua]KAH6633697.1 hypothetical protein C7974DRAFT_309044 [Boeremia exigua]